MQSHLKCYCILPQSNSCKNALCNYLNLTVVKMLSVIVPLFNKDI
jgi:hypothetical protein